MDVVSKYCTLIYYHILNFFDMLHNYMSEYYKHLRKEAFEDDEVIYKGYVNTYDFRYNTVYNHNTILYILYAYFLKCIELSMLRKKETCDDMNLRNRAFNIIIYIHNGEEHYLIHKCSRVIGHAKVFNHIPDTDPPNELPEASFALIDGCYDVTREYNIFRKFIYDDMMGMEFMSILIAVKLGKVTNDVLYDKMVVLDKNTFEEFSFKKYAQGIKQIQKNE